MEAKWPFLMIVLGLLFGLGYVVASLERNSVMSNWTTRRCELPVMVASRFFKPDSDPRSPADFSSENFSFCVQTYVEKFMALFIAPIQSLFSKQLNVTAGAGQMVNTIRKMAQTMYQAFTSYLGSYFKKFHASVFQMSRIVQHLRMAANRISAIATSMIYMGITLFRGMINSIQVVIRVVLIICAIMLAIIIILFFVLFPVIPIIMSTLTAIVTIVIALGAVMTSSVAGDAEKKKSGFCFAGSSRVSILRKDGTIGIKRVEDIVLDDELCHINPHTGQRIVGKVTEVMQFTGENVDMYEVNGIHVSGSHLIYDSTTKEWKEVSRDGRAKHISVSYPYLYCFNTTSNQIPILTDSLETVLFRDWEEMDDHDHESQKEWVRFIYEKLNHSTAHSESLNDPCETPLLCPSTPILTLCGWLSIRQLSIGDYILDEHDHPQKIIGIVKGRIYHTPASSISSLWRTAVYEWEEGHWKWKRKTYEEGTTPAMGIQLITENGTVVCWNLEEHRQEIIRDFTEIGHDEIHQTYSFVQNRLRSKNI